MNADIQAMTDSVLNDKDLMTRLENCGSSQEVSELLAEKGIEISAEKVDEFMMQQLGSEELNEEALEKVSGGSVL